MVISGQDVATQFKKSGLMDSDLGDVSTQNNFIIFYADLAKCELNRH